MLPILPTPIHLCLNVSHIYEYRLYTLYNLDGFKLRNYMVFEDLDGFLLIVNFNDETQLTLGRGHSS